MRLRVRFNDSIDRGSTTYGHLKIVTKQRAPVVSKFATSRLESKRYT
jgi:hypothetical protein